MIEIATGSHLSTSYYDVIMLGDDLAGVVAAAPPLLAPPAPR